MGMCMCAAIGGLPSLCPGISKSLVTPLFLYSVYCAVADTGGLQWFQLKLPLKERAPLINRYC